MHYVALIAIWEYALSVLWLHCQVDTPLARISGNTPKGNWTDTSPGSIPRTLDPGAKPHCRILRSPLGYSVPSMALGKRPGAVFLAALWVIRRFGSRRPSRPPRGQLRHGHGDASGEPRVGALLSPELLDKGLRTRQLRILTGNQARRTGMGDPLRWYQDK